MNLNQMQFMSTKELAEAARQTADGIRVTLKRKGHWHGIRPVKLGEGKHARLLWPVQEVQALLSRRAGEG